MGKYYIHDGTKWVDAMLNNIALWTGSAWAKIKEGDFYNNGTSWTPILRDAALSLGIRTAGGNMTAIYSYNNTLLNNPVISVIGSSHSISYGLPTEQGWQYKFQAYMDANHGGCTIHNLGVAGSTTNDLLPTANGGLSDRNVDAGLAFKPDILFVIAPTNDATINTPAQYLANLQLIYDTARKNGAYAVIHCPLPRGDFNETDQQDLADENLLCRPYFLYRYIDLFDSVLRDKTTGTAGSPNLIYFQPDHIHLNDDGTTVQVNAMIKLAERELRPNTAYGQFELERSDVDDAGFTLYDTITDQQVIRKEYIKEPGYYRVRALLKDGSYTDYSNVVQVTNAAPVADAGSDQTLATDTATVDITGSGSDTDGTIVSYLWEVVSGAGITLTNANAATVTVSGMANGQSYTLRLTVTDNNGATGSDTVGITVGSASTQVLKFNFGLTDIAVEGYETIFGNPHLAVLSGTQNGITVDTVSTSVWGALGGTTASDTNGEDAANPTFVFNAAVTRSFLFTYDNLYTPGNENIRISGFNPGEVVPLIEILASRDAAGIGAATRLCDYTLVDANGSTLVHDFDVKGNTANLVVFENPVANAEGELLLACYRRSPLDANHEVGYINAMHITRNT